MHGVSQIAMTSLIFGDIGALFSFAASETSERAARDDLREVADTLIAQLMR